MKHPIIRSASPFFDEGSIQAILKETEAVLRSGVLTDGPQAAEFENEFAHYCGTKYAVAVNSGTSALEIALRHFGGKRKRGHCSDEHVCGDA